MMEVGRKQQAGKGHGRDGVGNGGRSAGQEAALLGWQFMGIAQQPFQLSHDRPKSREKMGELFSTAAEVAVTWLVVGFDGQLLVHVSEK
jgi:hypothetical protein